MFVDSGNGGETKLGANLADCRRIPMALDVRTNKVVNLPLPLRDRHTTPTRSLPDLKRPSSERKAKPQLDSDSGHLRIRSKRGPGARARYKAVGSFCAHTEPLPPPWTSLSTSAGRSVTSARFLTGEPRRLWVRVRFICGVPADVLADRVKQCVTPTGLTTLDSRCPGRCLVCRSVHDGPPRSLACWRYAREVITTSVIERFTVDCADSTTKRR